MSYCENESYTKLKNKIIMKNAKYSINANLVYKNGYSGKNVNIAVLDTGVFEHKQLDGCIKHFMDFVGGKETCYDDNGHGTHVCGILSVSYTHLDVYKRQIQALTLWQSFEAYYTRRRLVIQVHLILMRKASFLSVLERQPECVTF